MQMRWALKDLVNFETSFWISDKIFIGLGSIPGVSDSSEIEVIDIDQPFKRCEKLSEYPFEIGFNAFGLMNGSPLICGGYKKTEPIRTNECYIYDKVRRI